MVTADAPGAASPSAQVALPGLPVSAGDDGPRQIITSRAGSAVSKREPVPKFLDPHHAASMTGLEPYTHLGLISCGVLAMVRFCIHRANRRGTKVS